MDIFGVYVMLYVIKVCKVSYHKEIARRQHHLSRSNSIYEYVAGHKNLDLHEAPPLGSDVVDCVKLKSRIQVKSPRSNASRSQAPGHGIL